VGGAGHLLGDARVAAALGVVLLGVKGTGGLVLRLGFGQVERAGRFGQGRLVHVVECLRLGAVHFWRRRVGLHRECRRSGRTLVLVFQEINERVHIQQLVLLHLRHELGLLELPLLAINRLGQLFQFPFLLLHFALRLLDSEFLLI